MPSKGNGFHESLDLEYGKRKMRDEKKGQKESLMRRNRMLYKKERGDKWSLLLNGSSKEK